MKARDVSTRKITSVKTSVMENKLEDLIQKNILFLTHFVDLRMSATLLTDLVHKIVYQDPTVGNRQPLWVIINSPGGSITQGFAIYDTLKMVRELGIEVNVVSIGNTDSMAVAILQAGTTRYSFPNTQFTVHQASLSGDGDRQEVNQLMESAKELERLNKIVLNIISERTGIDSNELFDLSKKTDYMFDADSALKFGKNGLIDHVITCLPFLKTA